jgi:hypothetical protein
MCRRPALVAPLEFTLPRADYLALGGHEGAIRDAGEVIARRRRIRDRRAAGPLAGGEE